MLLWREGPFGCHPGAPVNKAEFSSTTAWHIVPVPLVGLPKCRSFWAGVSGVINPLCEPPLGAHPQRNPAPRWPTWQVGWELLAWLPSLGRLDESGGKLTEWKGSSCVPGWGRETLGCSLWWECPSTVFHWNTWASLVAQWYRIHLPVQETWVGRIPWKKKWQPTPVFLPGKPHRERSLAWGHMVSMGS